MDKSTPHISKGFRKVLEIPIAYNLKGLVFGGEDYRRRHADSLNLTAGQRILDIGCGTANILKYLHPEVHYIGLDMEPKYISFCQAKWKDRGTFLLERVGESFNEIWKASFDVINIHGLLHHLSDEDSTRLLELTEYYLKDTGCAVTVDSVFHDGQSAVSRWLVSRDRGQNIRNPEGYLELARSYFKNIDSNLITDHLRIPYSIYRMNLYKDANPSFS